MDPTRRYQLTSGVRRSDRRKPRSVRDAVGAAGGIVAVALAASLVGMPLAFFLSPVPAGADAVTLCLPGVGPVQRFSGELTGELEEVVTIHELMHVQQCRTLGPTVWYLTYGTPEGRMRLEAEAFCAEIDVLARRGIDRETLFWPRVDLLYAGYGQDEGMSREQVRDLMRATCRFSGEVATAD